MTAIIIILKRSSALKIYIHLNQPMVCTESVIVSSVPTVAGIVIDGFVVTLLRKMCYQQRVATFSDEKTGHFL